MVQDVVAYRPLTARTNTICGISNGSNCDDLECTWRSFVNWKHFHKGCFAFVLQLTRVLLTRASRDLSTIS